MLFDIQRKDLNVKPKQPFNNRIEDNTWIQYKEVYRKILCVIRRSEMIKDKERAPYWFTIRQGDAFDIFHDAIKDRAKGNERIA